MAAVARLHSADSGDISVSDIVREAAEQINRSYVQRVMRMMMLSPPIVSMPFKLLLFVLVDGWALTMGSLANSFAS